MGLLNLTSDGLPSVGIAVARLLAEHGPTPMEDVIRLSEPAGLNRASDSMVQKTLNRWIQVGVFSDKNRLIALGPEFENEDLFHKKDPTLERFRSGVLRSVLANVHGPLEESPADDFIIAGWWFLQLDPVQASLGSAEEAIRAASRDHPGKYVLKNSTRWPGLLEWISFLGLGVTLGKLLVPNPTAAVRWAVEELDFVSGDRIPALDFVTALERRIPLLGNGAAAKAAAGYLNAPVMRSNERYTVPPTITVALLSLRAQGLLEFEGHQDTQNVAHLALPGGALDRVENVIVMEGVDA